MEEIRKFVDEMMVWAGVSGNSVPVLRHLLLTVTAILLAIISDFLCRKILVPLISKITEKTEASWDDVLFNKKRTQLGLPYCAGCRHPVAHATHLSGISDFQGNPRKSYGHLYRGDVCENRPYFHRVFQRTGRCQGSPVLCSTVFSYFLWRAQGSHALCCRCRGGGHPVGQESAYLVCWIGCHFCSPHAGFQGYDYGFGFGVRLTSNDMLHKGDWITVKSVDANGIVEEMSLTTVKVRNFDNTIVTISPTTLVNGSFQNWIGMQNSGGRRVKRFIYFDFRSIRLVDDLLKQKLISKHFATEDSFKLKESLRRLWRKTDRKARI